MKRNDLKIIHNIIRIRKMILVDDKHDMIHYKNGRMYPKLLINLNINKMMWRFRNNGSYGVLEHPNSSTIGASHMITDVKEIENGYQITYQL